MNKGFVVLHRKITEWEWYSDTNTFRVFLHLLLTANHKPSKFRGFEVGRGQIIIGRKALAENLNLTEREVRTAIEHLKTTGELTIKTTNRFSIATLTKYWVYQDKKPKTTSQTTSQTTDKRPTNDQQTTTSKQCNNINNENKENKGESTVIDSIEKLDPANDVSYLAPSRAMIIHNELLKALGKIQVSPEEIMIAEQLIAIGCNYDDIAAARKLKGKNSLQYLKNVVCECRDQRKTMENTDDIPV